MLKMIEENLILVAVFILTLIVLLMIWNDPTLTENEGFMYLATGIIITGLINGIVNKTNADQQRSQSATIQTLATAATSTSAPPKVDELVVESGTTTVNTNGQSQPTGDQPPAASPRPAWVDAPIG